MKTLAYAALNLNDDIRNKSSSGGIFYEIAKYVVLNDGVVYGARYDDHWLVVHDHTENIKDISSFLGSKYVQSNMNNQYEKIKIDLMSGRLVLFSGTPCQIRGLQCFLGKEYENLITVDFICHGVPSPKVWEKYINELSNGHNITKINFRDKSKGWQHFSLRIDFSDGNYYSKTQQEDLYMRGFLQDIYLRPSCYQCRFKGIERKSDLTLADYWGINNIYPELYDDKGTSLIFIHSKKGKNIFLKISNSLKK
ncbi:MAG: Coenzyme F420 hydrogenase/dehydrogenase, beta subunit C-terminal domain [Erysipelotrichaceae bacterium]|nr:Coenzyme F420 hydrogenase/dehydrogenase, beta subunit C-terminal domain [Erysipelotrichaceae bacterium]